MKPNVFDLPYHVTKDGKVYSFTKTNGWRLRKLKMVTKGNRKSYRIRIHIAGKIDRHFSVSRLVAMIYIPNHHNYPCVCHKDNNPLNNQVHSLKIDLFNIYRMVLLKTTIICKFNIKTI